MIGWHFQFLRFPETEDFFMLNRILSLIAEFLEAHPDPHTLSADSVLSTELLFPELAALEAAYTSSSSTSASDSSSSSSSTTSEDANEAIQEEEEEEIPVEIFEEAAAGDPDLAASIRLALKLQQKEYEGRSSSDSSSSSSEVSWSTLLQQVAGIFLSYFSSSVVCPLHW